MRSLPRVPFTRVGLLFLAAIPAGLVTGLAPTASGASIPVRYYWARAFSQTLRQPARGMTATMTIEHPRQVADVGDRELANHSLAEIEVQGRRTDRLEAGWEEDPGAPTYLFINYWHDGRSLGCNTGCGFVRRGPGIAPGHALRPGRRLTVAWRHAGPRWWLLVDGRRSGYYPDALWRGRFTGVRFAQAFGEVLVSDHLRDCVDMGSGRYPWQRGAASFSRIAFIGGPRIQLGGGTYASTGRARGYAIRRTGPADFRYGGPGRC